MVESVVLIKTRRLDQCKRLPFQIGSLSATFSTNGCRADLRSLVSAKGIPRYLIGKAAC
jgi:hypothetical protein